MFGSWPIAANTPSASSSQVSSVFTSRSRTPVTRSSPSTSSTTAFVTHSIFVVRAGAVEHDLRRPEVFAAVDDRDLGRRTGSGSVASSIAESPPPTTTTCLSREEGRVAGRAVRDAAALQPLLGLEPELPGGGAGRDDDRLGEVLLVADPDAEGPLGEVDLRHVVGDEARRRSARPGGGSPASSRAP